MRFGESDKMPRTTTSTLLLLVALAKVGNSNLAILRCPVGDRMDFSLGSDGFSQALTRVEISTANMPFSISRSGAYSYFIVQVTKGVDNVYIKILKAISIRYTTKKQNGWERIRVRGR